MANNECEPDVERSRAEALAERERIMREEREFTLHFSDRDPITKNMDCNVTAGGFPGVVVDECEAIEVIEKLAYTRMADALGYLRGVMIDWTMGEPTPGMTEVDVQLWNLKRGLK